MKKNVIEYVRKFQKGKLSRRDFLKEVNQVILDVPKYLGYNCKDIKHEFYARIISRIDKMILSYKELDTATFATWFNLVLKRDFFTFIKKRNKKEKLENSHIHEILFRDISYNNYSHSNEKEVEIPELSFLSDKEKNVVSLKFGINLNNNNIRDSINQIIEKLDKRKKIEQRITKNYLSLIDLQKMMQNEIEPESILKHKQKEEKIRGKKRKLEKIYERFNILPSNRWVANKLGLSEGTIAAYLHKIRSKVLKNKIGDLS